jgi:predicted MarR family transcription regulator
MSGSVADAATFTILWDRNAETDVTGYKLSWGTASRQYSTTIDVGNQISYVFTGADPTLRYYFAVQAYNVGGLLSAYSVEAVTVAVNNDATAPVISAVTLASITASGATVTWTTNEASDSQVDFGLTTAYGSTSAWDGALVTAHTVSLTGLTTGTLYHVRVRSRDAAGNLSVSGDVTLITLTVNNDTTPPVISAVTVVSMTVSGATVTWTTNDASDSQVDLGLTTAYGSTSAWNGALVTAHSVSLTGLTGATSYHIRVRSRDAAGNLALSDDMILRRPLRGDVDGDGKADLTIYRPSTGTWFTRQSSTDYGTASPSVQWGVNGDLPVPGDYDGDGKMDLAVYRPANGTWYILQSSTNFMTYLTYQWGLSDDIAVPGDFDGDGKTDLAVWRPSSGVWFIRESTTGYASSVAFQWGVSGDIPVAGDFDGDGKVDLAVFRPSIGTWFLRRSSTDFIMSSSWQWGLQGDIPILGRR